MKSGPGGGAVVAKPDKESLADSLTFLLEAEGARVQDVADVRCVLEPMIANFAARRITDEQLDRLTETVELMRSKPHNPSLVLEQNSLFHKLVAAAADNVVLDIFLKSLALVPERTGSSVRCTPEEAELAAAAHEGVIAALRTRDPAVAEHVMRRHVVAATQYCEQEYPMLMSRAIEWIF
jgi:DNA-binding FadR family transcriptional regulator